MEIKNYEEAERLLYRESDNFESIQIRLFAGDEAIYKNFTPQEEEQLYLWLKKRHESNN